VPDKKVLLTPAEPSSGQHGQNTVVPCRCPACAACLIETLTTGLESQPGTAQGVQQLHRRHAHAATMSPPTGAQTCVWCVCVDSTQIVHKVETQDLLGCSAPSEVPETSMASRRRTHYHQNNIKCTRPTRVPDCPSQYLQGQHRTEYRHVPRGPHSASAAACPDETFTTDPDAAAVSARVRSCDRRHLRNSPTDRAQPRVPPACKVPLVPSRQRCSEVAGWSVRTWQPVLSSDRPRCS
jgi:hypothetical protein